MTRSDRAATLEEARAQFQKSCLEGMGPAEAGTVARLEQRGGAVAHCCRPTTKSPHTSAFPSLNPCLRQIVGRAILPSRQKQAEGTPMRWGIFGTAAFAAAVGACAGRDAQPIAVVQPHDQGSDCAMITAEIQANNTKVSELANEKGMKVVQNVAAGVVGIVVWPMFFAMDSKGAASTEMTALQARQEYLARLAEQRCAHRAR
jgi:hypothetical protein